uniref:7TM_GPCR_Srx domain-containing protein n=1 Tax=Steinernema glaseri TaxID=37863 RepID=A0A1I8A3P3_9BILA
MILDLVLCLRPTSFHVTDKKKPSSLSQQIRGFIVLLLTILVVFTQMSVTLMSVTQTSVTLMSYHGFANVYLAGWTRTDLR